MYPWVDYMMFCISKMSYLVLTWSHPPFPYGCEVPILVLLKGPTMKAVAYSPLKVTINIHMSCLEKSSWKLHIQGRMPTF